MIDHIPRSGKDRRIFQYDDQNHFDGKGVRWQAVAWFLGVIVTALITYNTTANGFDKRLSVLESQRRDGERRLQRIENKLDILLDK